jgi:hypothetical protein
VLQGFFSTLNPFLHSKIQFKQQKVVIHANYVDKALSFYRIWFTLGTILGMKGSAQWVSPGNALCGKKKIKKLNVMSLSK